MATDSAISRGRQAAMVVDRRAKHSRANGQKLIGVDSLRSVTGASCSPFPSWLSPMQRFANSSRHMLYLVAGLGRGRGDPNARLLQVGRRTKEGARPIASSELFLGCRLSATCSEMCSCLQRPSKSGEAGFTEPNHPHRVAGGGAAAMVVSAQGQPEGGVRLEIARCISVQTLCKCFGELSG